MGLVEVIEAFISPGGIVLLEEPFSLSVRHLCIVYFDLNGRAAISGEENIMPSHNQEIVNVQRATMELWMHAGGF